MNNDTYRALAEKLAQRGFPPAERRQILSRIQGMPPYPAPEQAEHHLQRAIEDWNLTEGGD